MFQGVQEERSASTMLTTRWAAWASHASSTTGGAAGGTGKVGAGGTGKVGADGGAYHLAQQDRSSPPEFVVYRGGKKVQSGKFEFG